MRYLSSSAALIVAATTLLATPLAARDRDRDTFVITANQVIDMADARIAQLKADLRLNPDQDKNWGSLQTALHDMAQRRADRMTKMRDQRAASSDAPVNTTGTAPANTTGTAPVNTTGTAMPANDRDARGDRDRDDRGSRSPDLIAEMRRQADMMTVKADDYRKFADAAAPLYGSLDDGQRRRFMAFVERSMTDDDEGGGRRGRW